MILILSTGPESPPPGDLPPEADAALGLIIASLLGGPIAKFLIERHGLAPLPQ